MTAAEITILSALQGQIMTFRELARVLPLPEDTLHQALDSLLDQGHIHADPRTADESEYTKV